MSNQSASASSDSGYFTDHGSLKGRKQEIYIPAPVSATQDESLRFHLATRNLFAWMFGKPLVSNHLGNAMVDLLDRLNEYRPHSHDGNMADILRYLEIAGGYLDFRECPDHALAVLNFAEVFEIQDLWMDAFVHCAGMSDRISGSSEYKITSRASKQLIDRTATEMEQRLQKAETSISTFLEDDLSGSYLGLGPNARIHLDHFRSCLQSYYINKYGYWPPDRRHTYDTDYPTEIWSSMYKEFLDLYAYLVDGNSSISIQDNKPANGGICVLQNIRAFDERHQYDSFPHPLPLIPESLKELKQQQSLNSFSTLRIRQSLGGSGKKSKKQAKLMALIAATNSNDLHLLSKPLVREYANFEKTFTLGHDEDGVTSDDARKVRWLLIYTMLQTLDSVTSTPAEVKNTDGITYPVCLQTRSVVPPWRTNASKPRQQERPPPYASQEQKKSSGSDNTFIAIEPDFKYDAQKALNLSDTLRRRSTASPSIMRAISRRASISVSRRSSLASADKEKQMPQLKRKPSHQEILIHGYGNGLNPVELSSPSQVSLQAFHPTTDSSAPNSTIRSSIDSAHQTSEISSPISPTISSGFSSRAESTSSESLPDMEHWSVEGDPYPADDDYTLDPHVKLQHSPSPTRRTSASSLNTTTTITSPTVSTFSVPNDAFSKTEPDFSLDRPSSSQVSTPKARRSSFLSTRTTNTTRSRPGSRSSNQTKTVTFVDQGCPHSVHWGWEPASQSDTESEAEKEKEKALREFEEKTLVKEFCFDDTGVIVA